MSHLPKCKKDRMLCSNYNFNALRSLQIIQYLMCNLLTSFNFEQKVLTNIVLYKKQSFTKLTLFIPNLRINNLENLLLQKNI
jgi:hypothetical protein